MKIKKMKKHCRIIQRSDGVFQIQAPDDRTFIESFLSTVPQQMRDKKDDRWIVSPDYLLQVIDLALVHFTKIEGLDQLMASDYDIIGVSPELPLPVIEKIVKTLRIEYHPDRIHSQEDIDRLFPGSGLSIGDAKQAATNRVQEITDALNNIKAAR